MSERKRFVSEIVEPEGQTEPAWWFAFAGDKLLVREESARITVPFLKDFSKLHLTILRQHYLGRLEDQRCYAVEVAGQIAPPVGWVFEGLREIYGRLDEELFWISTRAIQIVEWDKTHQFCGRCGAPMEAKKDERAKECPQCGLLHFPRLAPAIIVLIQRGRQLLLARSHRFPSGMHSVLAGFVEPGETLEEAVVREVREEVGISIKDIRYFGSQPWPFPHSLMLGFTATYDSGEITLKDPEIEAAGWFTAGNLPPLPGKISIARKLIDWFLEKQDV